MRQLTLKINLPKKKKIVNQIVSYDTICDYHLGTYKTMLGYTLALFFFLAQFNKLFFLLKFDSVRVFDTNFMRYHTSIKLCVAHKRCRI